MRKLTLAALATLLVLLAIGVIRALNDTVDEWDAVRYDGFDEQLAVD